MYVATWCLTHVYRVLASGWRAHSTQDQFPLELYVNEANEGYELLPNYKIFDVKWPNVYTSLCNQLVAIQILHLKFSSFNKKKRLEASGSLLACFAQFTKETFVKNSNANLIVSEWIHKMHIFKCHCRVWNVLRLHFFPPAFAPRWENAPTTTLSLLVIYFYFFFVKMLVRAWFIRVKQMQFRCEQLLLFLVLWK